MKFNHDKYFKPLLRKYKSKLSKGRLKQPGTFILNRLLKKNRNVFLSSIAVYTWQVTKGNFFFRNKTRTQ